MPLILHLRRIFYLIAFAIVAHGVASRAEAAIPRIALAPVTLHEPDTIDGSQIVEGAALADIVQLTLQADADSSARDFVERLAIDTLLREQNLSLSEAAAETGTVRVGRLLHADWILRLRFHADTPAHPRLVAEVIDSLRADLLVRVESPLPQPPTARSLEQPSESLARLASTTAARALSAAGARVTLLANRTTLAPLVLINRSGTDRVAPLAGHFREALRKDHPATHALGFAAPDESFAESALFLAGLTDLEPKRWATVADAYLWGEFAEDDDYTGPVADTPVSLTLHLWREGDVPAVLEFTGTLGALDELAHRAAAAALDAAAGANLVPTPEARHAAATRLISVADPLTDAPRTRHLIDAETPLARRARESRCVQLLGLASFFNPADIALRERYLALRCTFAPHHPARARWADDWWRHVEQHLLKPDGTPDLALLSRAINSPYLDYGRPGFAARTARFGSFLKKHPPAEPIVRKLWSRFLAAAQTSPDDPGLRPALESLWPLIRRAHPDVTDFSVRASMQERGIFARIYRDDPARLRALLTDRLFPLDLSPLPATDPAASPARQAGTPPPAPLSRRPAFDPANPFLAFQESTPDTLLSLAREGPLAKLPQLSAPVRKLPLWALDQTRPSRDHFPSLPATAHIGDFTTDGRHLWLSLVPPSLNDSVWRHHRAARVDLDTRLLSWPPLLADSPASISSLWLENPDEIWAATRGGGLRILRHDHTAPLVLDSSHGLPRDDVFQLRRGHDAVFLAVARDTDANPATRTATAVDLHDHRVTRRSADAGPELADLPASARAAIASFTDDIPQHVLLPDAPAVASFSADAPVLPPGYERMPPALRARFSPVRAGGTGLPSDPAKPHLAILTGPRDGYWVASNRSVIWASGSRRHPLVHWLSGKIGALADDGRRLLVRVHADSQADLFIRDDSPPDPAVDRVFVYDYTEGRWLGWLPLPANGFLQAAGGRLLIALSPHSPLTVLDTSALHEASPADKSSAAPAQSAPANRADRDLAKTKIRQRDRVFHVLNNPPADLDTLSAEIAAGLDPLSAEYGPQPLILVSLGKKDFPAVALFLRNARTEHLQTEVNNLPLGLHLLRGALEARRLDLARRILDLGYRPVRPKNPHHSIDTIGWLAVRSGDVALVSRLHDLGFPLETSIEQHALREAVAQRNLPLLRFLLDTPRGDGHPRDPDDSSGNGLTPLFAATDLGWAEGVRALLDAGARNFHGDHATGRSLQDAVAPWPEIGRLLSVSRSPVPR